MAILIAKNHLQELLNYCRVTIQMSYSIRVSYSKEAPYVLQVLPKPWHYLFQSS